MNILEKNESEHEITAVGYCVGVPDLDGEFINDPLVLKSAVDDFLKRPRYNIDHDNDQELTGIEVLESRILTKGEAINGNYINPGCWILKLKIDPDSWPLIHDGSGVSIQGKAEYLEVQQ